MGYKLHDIGNGLRKIATRYADSLRYSADSSAVNYSSEYTCPYTAVFETHHKCKYESDLLFHGVHYR